MGDDEDDFEINLPTSPEERRDMEEETREENSRQEREVQLETQDGEQGREEIDIDRTGELQGQMAEEEQQQEEEELRPEETETANNSPSPRARRSQRAAAAKAKMD